jgi:hypothetical protein
MQTGSNDKTGCSHTGRLPAIRATTHTSHAESILWIRTRKGFAFCASGCAIATTSLVQHLMIFSG